MTSPKATYALVSAVFLLAVAFSVLIAGCRRESAEADQDKNLDEQKEKVAKEIEKLRQATVAEFANDRKARAAEVAEQKLTDPLFASHEVEGLSTKYPTSTTVVNSSSPIRARMQSLKAACERTDHLRLNIPRSYEVVVFGQKREQDAKSAAKPRFAVVPTLNSGAALGGASGIDTLNNWREAGNASAGWVVERVWVFLTPSDLGANRTVRVLEPKISNETGANSNEPGVKLQLICDMPGEAAVVQDAYTVVPLYLAVLERRAPTK